MNFYDYTKNIFAHDNDTNQQFYTYLRKIDQIDIEFDSFHRINTSTNLDSFKLD